jgi:hypothetical protein
MIGNNKETKQLAVPENKALRPVAERPEPKYHRAPTGGDGGTEELLVRIVDGKLDIRTFRRSPDSFGAKDWHPTAAGITVALPYHGELLAAIRAATAGEPITGEEFRQMRRDMQDDPEILAAREHLHATLRPWSTDQSKGAA